MKKNRSKIIEIRAIIQLVTSSIMEVIFKNFDFSIFMVSSLSLNIILIAKKLPYFIILAAPELTAASITAFATAFPILLSKALGSMYSSESS